jgi:hypothetical protein
MIVSKLLKSCATPPVSWPMPSIFWACTSCSCAFCSAIWASRRSLTSRVTLAKPISRPSLSAMRLITTLAQKREPSLRTRQPSVSNLPLSRAMLSARSGAPALRSSSV